MKRFELVDFLKGYSISATVLFHYSKHLHLSNPFEKIMLFGGTGVHLFILLSGFGLYYSYLKRPLTYFSFLKKRLSKIYVPYIFVILLSAFISLFIPIYENSLYALGGHIFLYRMFDESIIGSYGYPLWFISMMLQFYFTFHILVWMKSKLKNKPFLILSILISITWTISVVLIHKEGERIWNSFFLQYFWEFVFGMVIADKASKNENFFDQNMKQLPLIVTGLTSGLFCALLVFKAGASGRLFNDFFALIATASLAIFLYNLKINAFNKLCLYLGKISTPVYLLHIVLIRTITYTFTSLTPVYIVLLALVTIIPASLVYQRMMNAYFKLMKF
jgi:peptidoglycan/LPS O-acetylase OafA/YrhL